MLVLLPTSAGSLTAQWQGPYPVLHRIGTENYLVDMHDTRKRERTFHVNMLKKWNNPTYGNLWGRGRWRGLDRGGRGDSLVERRW